MSIWLYWLHKHTPLSEVSWSQEEELIQGLKLYIAQNPFPLCSTQLLSLYIPFYHPSSDCDWLPSLVDPFVLHLSHVGISCDVSSGFEIINSVSSLTTFQKIDWRFLSKSFSATDFTEEIW